MFRIFSIIITLTIFTGCALNNKSMRPKGDNIIYLESTVIDHMQETQEQEREAANEFLKLMGNHYQSYKPKSEVINSLNAIAKDKFNKVNIVMYGGNWCPDTHEGIPSFIKVLDEINFPKTNIAYHRVSRDKQQIDGLEARTEIKSVPTVILFNRSSGDEIGRIVEFPRESWEEDLLKALVNGL